MKRIATLAVILLMGLTASANSIRYFTESQAIRTVRYLNAQNEMMIYCGYEYELETYVLINEVWMERVNSAYYEIWVFGYDAYTGDEVYMPLDLGCVWLFSAGRIYNAAQFLRFHATVHTPHITWYVPAYNPYTRILHRHGYVRSYHYNIHRYGWMPPAYHHGPGMPPPLPPYYMRHPGSPVPHPTNTWTPGVDRPVVTAPSTEGRTGTAGRVINGNNNNNGSGSSGVRTGGNVGTRGNATTGNNNTRGTSTSGSTGSSRGTTTGTTNTRGTSTNGSTGSTNTRGTSTSSSRGNATTGTTPTRGNTTSASGSTRGTSAAATTETSTDKPKSNTRGTSTSSTTSGRGTSTSGTTSNRGTTSSGRGTTNNR